MGVRKTLILFDTNRLRQVISDAPAYHEFTFGNEFERLRAFLQDNGLGSSVDIATTRMTLTELLKQKVEQFESDKEKLNGIIRRMSALPSTDFNSLQVPAESFDCHGHLAPKVEDFLRQSNVVVIDLPEEKYAEVLKRILDRAVKKKPPFVKTDGGFKDVVIWESLLHFDRLADYDKVYLVSNDNGFDGCCKSEFEAEKQKIIAITPSVQLLIESLEEDYENEIEKHEFAQFAGTDYFKSHIDGIVTGLVSVTIDGNVCAVYDVAVVNYLESVSYPEEENVGVSAILISMASGRVMIEGTEKPVKILIKTVLDETNGVLEYTSEGFL